MTDTLKKRLDAFTIDGDLFIALINEEEQYSIWPDFKEIPLGWKDANFRGAKAACLEHINTVWTDMRPLSLRLKMNATTA
jgi:MbtH protein